MIRSIKNFKACGRNFPLKCRSRHEVHKWGFPKSLHDWDCDPTDHRKLETTALRRADGFGYEKPTRFCQRSNVLERLVQIGQKMKQVMRQNRIVKAFIKTVLKNVGHLESDILQPFFIKLLIGNLDHARSEIRGSDMGDIRCKQQRS